jgi:hypothetical protein
VRQQLRATASASGPLNVIAHRRVRIHHPATGSAHPHEQHDNDADSQVAFRDVPVDFQHLVQRQDCALRQTINGISTD